MTPTVEYFIKFFWSSFLMNAWPIFNAFNFFPTAFFRDSRNENRKEKSGVHERRVKEKI